MTFEPRSHTIKLPGRKKKDGSIGPAVDYLQVKDRVRWVRDEHPDVDMSTSVIELTDSRCVMLARVSIPGGGAASDIGSETKAAFFDYIEKASTVALGRALAILGYGIEFADEFEESKEEADKKDYELNQANTVAAKSPPLRPGATKPAPNVGAMVANGTPLTPDLPEGAEPAQLREWFTRRLKTIKPLRWNVAQKQTKPQALAMDLKQHGFKETDRPDLYEWLTGVKSAKEMSDEQIYLLEANAHRTAELTACAEAMRTERANLAS